MSNASTSSNFSLKAKLITMTITIVILLGGSSFFVFNRILKAQQSALEASFQAQATSLSDAIGAQYFERYGDIQAFALNPNLLSADKRVIADTLNAYSALYLIYDLIMIVDRNGNLVSVTDKDPTGKEINVTELYKQNFANEAWFKETIEGRTTDDKDKGFVGTYAETVINDKWASMVYGGNRLGTSFSAQMKDKNGRVIGVITNRAGSRWFEVAFKEVYMGLKAQELPDSELALQAADGTLLYSYNPEPTATKTEESKYNWDQLLKGTRFEKESNLLRATTNERVGSGTTMDEKTGEKVVYAFSRVQSLKFTESLGWTAVVLDPAKEAMAKITTTRNLFLIVFAIAMSLGVLLAYWFANKLSGSLSNLANILSQGANRVARSSTEIADSSTKLSDLSTEQAAAIQETAASIDEISAMVSKNSENATRSQGTSKESRDMAESGTESVKRVIVAISDISTSNDRIMNQVLEGNKKIEQIVQVISEISNKTKVINDIVFQTKLLSFNASVEAARAGEHGKGFAVVAEEVGNLAQMSGNAAKEISDLLDQSFKKVESIVEETRSSVERLVEEGKEKVETGRHLAQDCNAGLETIKIKVSDVDSMIAEIATASREQSIGVNEINQAMNNFDQTTQRNTQVATATARSAEALNKESIALKHMVEDLLAIIYGSNMLQKPNQDQADDQMPIASVTPIKTATKNVEREPSKAKKAQQTVEQSIAGTISIPSKDDPRFEEL